LDQENKEGEKAMSVIGDIKKQLEERLAALGKERDALRELESELTDHRERCEDACDSLTYAIDRLSEVV
jgi:DNA repair ATPase RecN